MNDILNISDSTLVELAQYVHLYLDQVLLLEAKQRGIEGIRHEVKLFHYQGIIVLSCFQNAVENEKGEDFR